MARRKLCGAFTCLGDFEQIIEDATADNVSLKLYTMVVRNGGAADPLEYVITPNSRISRYNDRLVVLNSMGASFPITEIIEGDVEIYVFDNRKMAQRHVDNLNREKAGRPKP